MNKDYKIIIIGAGAVGTSIAHSLARFDVTTLVIEKNSDVGDETSCANSAIVHSGYDPHPGTNKAKYNVLGNKMFAKLCSDLDVEFKQIGSLTIATNKEEDEKLLLLQKNGLENGVETKILTKEELLEIEPFVTENATSALYAKSAGIVNPFELCVAYMENAMDNGVVLHLNEKCINVDIENQKYIVTTDKDKYLCDVVINACGVYSDEINNYLCKYGVKEEKIIPRKGEYYVLDHFNKPYVTHTLFSLPSDKGKGILVSPTTHNNYLLGPSSEFSEEKDDVSTDKITLDNVMKSAKSLVKSIPTDQIIRSFSGVRAYHQSNEFVINSPLPGFINFLGIQSPGLVSSPALGERAVEMVKQVLELSEKDNYNPKCKKRIRLNTLSLEEKMKIIKEDANFGIIVCRCEKISLGEIYDVINRNCGATTIKGVKKRCRPGFGKCQGGFCEPLVLKALCDKLGLDPLDVRYSNQKSFILKEETKRK